MKSEKDVLIIVVLFSIVSRRFRGLGHGLHQSLAHRQKARIVDAALPGRAQTFYCSLKVNNRAGELYPGTAFSCSSVRAAPCKYAIQ